MKVSLGFNLQTGAFGGGNQFGRLLGEYLTAQGVSVSHDLAIPDLDIILLMEPDISLQTSAYNHYDILRYLRQTHSDTIVVQRFNNTSQAQQDTHDRYNAYRLEANRIADYSVFVSQWAYEQYTASGFESKNYRVILNGGDESLWHPLAPPKASPQSPLKIVTHHWSTHPNKGFDIYRRLDELLTSDKWAKRIEFTFIGRLPDRVNFKATRYIEPLSGQALADELRKHDLYLTASRHEAGPNHCIEGAMCGLPLLYIKSGAMPEYGAGFGLEFTLDNFESQLENMLENYEQWAAKMPDYPHVSTRTSQSYHALFQELIAQRDPLLVRRQWTAPKVMDSQRHAIDWLQSIRQPLVTYVQSLQLEGNVGRYLPMHEGRTNTGDTIALPFSCHALKTLYMLGAWQALPHSEQKTWITAIQAFQTKGNPLHLRWGQNGFVDPVLMQHVAWQSHRLQRWKERFIPPKGLTRLDSVMSGESKQAIATLVEVGANTKFPYKGFPTQPKRLQTYLNNLDWTQPWGAGAHLATVAVYYQTQAPRFLSAKRVAELISLCQAFSTRLVEAKTGAYFLGEVPHYGQLINGAMKVLTALDWLALPIHHPQKLIDTTLAALPSAEGCHLVDAVYVLYRCAQFTDYRRADIQAYCLRVVKMLMKHFNPLDGGFSYHVDRSQVAYHGVVISSQRPVSDIHGTLLLTWASAMILHLLDADTPWRVIKP